MIDSNDALLFAANYGVGFPSLDGTTGNAVALGGSAAAVPEPASMLLAAADAVLVQFAGLQRSQFGGTGSGAKKWPNFN